MEKKNNDVYIDFGVAPYALPKVCESLFNNGITNAFLTMEGDDIHVRWKYNINRESMYISETDNEIPHVTFR